MYSYLKGFPTTARALLVVKNTGEHFHSNLSCSYRYLVADLLSPWIILFIREICTGKRKETTAGPDASSPKWFYNCARWSCSMLKLYQKRIVGRISKVYWKCELNTPIQYKILFVLFIVYSVNFLWHCKYILKRILGFHGNLWIFLASPQWYLFNKRGRVRNVSLWVPLYNTVFLKGVQRGSTIVNLKILWVPRNPWNPL